jgi:DNA-binding PadR family transcriptional regulator
MWPLETDVLVTLSENDAGPDSEGIHGYALAQLITPDPKDRVIRGVTNDGGRWLADTGLIYKALKRLERVGALTSRWEDPDVALAERRPRRKYYSLTSNGVARASKAPLGARMRRRRLELHRQYQERTSLRQWPRESQGPASRVDSRTMF